MRGGQLSAAAPFSRLRAGEPGGGKWPRHGGRRPSSPCAAGPCAALRRTEPSSPRREPPLLGWGGGGGRLPQGRRWGRGCAASAGSRSEGVSPNNPRPGCKCPLLGARSLVRPPRRDFANCFRSNGPSWPPSLCQLVPQALWSQQAV